MSKNTDSHQENQVLSSQDELNELLRSGAQRLIAQPSIPKWNKCLLNIRI